MDSGELLLEKPEVFVYKIPPDILSEPGELIAYDWDLSNPVWFGKIRIHAAGSSCLVHLQDKNGIFYGRSIIDEMPGKTFAPVVDSSRYFTLDFEDLEGKRGLIGIGFSSREDSIEVKEVITEYFVKVCRNANKRTHDNKPNILGISLAKKAKKKKKRGFTKEKCQLCVSKPRNENNCEMCEHLDGKEILNMRHLCDELIWSCGICEQNFSLEYLQRHCNRENHTLLNGSGGRKPLRWKCRRCPIGFAKRRTLVTHAYKVHVSENQKEPENDHEIDGIVDYDVIDQSQGTKIKVDRDSETGTTATANDGGSPNKIICQRSNISNVKLTEPERITNRKDIMNYNDVLISSAIQVNYSGSPPLYCGLCNIKFANIHMIPNHLLQVHSLYYWKCGRCGKVFDSVDKIRNHFFSHVNLFTCPRELLANPWPWRVSYNQTWLRKCCNQIFLTDIMWKEHYLTSHTKPDDFQCVRCSQKFGNHTSLSTHVMKHLLSIASKKIQKRRKRIKAQRAVNFKKKLNSDNGPTTFPKAESSEGTDCQVTNLSDVMEVGEKADNGNDDNRMETDQKYEIKQENQSDTTHQQDPNKDKTILKTEPIETNNSADNLLGTELQDKHTEQVSVKTESKAENHGETTIKIESPDADQLEFVAKVLQEVSQGETRIKIEFQDEETGENVPIKIEPREDNQGEIPATEFQCDNCMENVVIKNEPADVNTSQNPKVSQGYYY